MHLYVKVKVDVGRAGGGDWVAVGFFRIMNTHISITAHQSVCMYSRQACLNGGARRGCNLFHFTHSSYSGCQKVGVCR